MLCVPTCTVHTHGYTRVAIKANTLVITTQRTFLLQYLTTKPKIDLLQMSASIVNIEGKLDVLILTR